MHTRTRSHFFRWRPTKFDGYVLSELLGPLAGSFFFFSFVFLMFQALRLAEFLIVHAIPFLTVMKLVALLTISFIPQALPLAFLISTFVSFGRLSSDSELVAIKASGVSVWRMSVAVIAAALVVCCLTLFSNMQIVPMGLRNFKSTLLKLSSTRVSSSIKPGTFTEGFFDLLVYTDSIDNKANTLNHVFIYDEREPENPMVITARKGGIIPLKVETELGSASILKLKTGNIHRVEPEGESYQKIDFDEYRLYLSFEETHNGFFVKPKMLRHSELKAGILDAKIRKDDSQLRSLSTELWNRYAIALSPLIFAFLGIGYGTVRTRSVKSSAALISFLVIAGYWSLQLLSTSLSLSGSLPPALAAQLPNFAVLLASLFGMKKASW